MNYFSWYGTPLRYNINAAVIAIIILLYLWLIVLDFVSKEVHLWKILLVCLLNVIVPLPVIAVYGNHYLMLFMLISIPIWLISIYVNTKLNKETIIGMGDVDIFLMQLFLNVSIVLWKVFSTNDIIYAAYVFKVMLFSILVGISLTLLIWFFNFIFKVISNKEKKKLKDIYSSSKEVAAMVVFLPLVVSTLYMMLS